jgi:uncharacterized membrane protein (UPF0127 family)
MPRPEAQPRWCRHPIGASAHSLLLACAALPWLQGCAGGPGSGGAPVLVSIRARGHVLQAEVAADPMSRARGLMFRRALGENEGMLFVFPRDERASFYMRNTYIPLSIAFLDRTATILNIEEMRPLDERPRSARGLVRYALEARAGWFERRRIRPGDRLAFELPPRLTVR